MAEGIVDYYRHLLTETIVIRRFPASYSKRKLDAGVADVLTRPFSEVEVLAAIKRCNGWKAPGPDGFSIEFYKKRWDRMKGELMAAINELHIYDILPKSASHSFICLAPKRDVVEDVRDLRPISLLGSLTKS
ncbi:unnamed protein product [Linum trigynum]|uniref:Reverse transcriptase n=1 Tax=Linum trigynum TaxID=586398 RepID=A0AAV2FRN8_9ROSI